MSIWKPVKKTSDDKPQDEAQVQPLNQGPNWITIIALAALLFVVARGWVGPSPRPDDPPTPDERTSRVTHACAIGGLVSVRSTRVAQLFNDAGIEYRRYSPGNRPVDAEPEFLKLYDEGIERAPIFLYLYKNGKTSDHPIPKTADELMVYIKDKIDA